MTERGTPSRLRVFLVDDHAMFRAGVRAELAGQVTPEPADDPAGDPVAGDPVAGDPGVGDRPADAEAAGHEEAGGRPGPVGIDMVGEAGTVAEAVRQIVALRPDVVLLDVHMPDGGGRAVLEAVRQQLGTGGAAVRFLALSVSDAAEDVIGLIRAGARGYVTKSISSQDLAAAIRRVADGDAVFSPRLAGFVLDAFAARPDAPVADPELDQLTTREREVLRLLARGYAYKEIAKELFISIKTVETHVSNVLRKLQMSNRYELSRWAADRRLV
jgi:DNA-binding NarL/FixJ family response regulator